MPLLEWLLWIQNTRVGTAIRESAYPYIIITGFHALGLAVSVGIVLWFDLRLLGLKMLRQPVSQVYRQLMPWMLGGFAIVFTSGILLFWAQAGRCYESGFCRTKILLLPLPGINALIYHLATKRDIAQWDGDPLPPLRARIAGLVSLASWVVIIVLGRQIDF